jgi:small nuclear ribonucleoprotein (snRNP)-like protein
LKAPDWGITCYNKVIAKKKNFPEGGINSYDDLMNVTREYVEETSNVNVEGALADWDEVHNAGWGESPFR